MKTNSHILLMTKMTSLVLSCWSTSTSYLTCRIKYFTNFNTFIPAKILAIRLLLTIIVQSSYGQQSYTFTTCGATGRFGPTQAQVNTAYASTNLNGSVAVTGTGIQIWTVSISGLYRIAAYGAQGGNESATKYGGRGAIMMGDVNLVAGTILYILVGQQGGAAPTYYGGGGGSFVAIPPNIPLVVAGGGGGAGGTGGGNGVDATITTNGTAGGAGGAGGINGNGGLNTNSNAGSGGGFFTDGTSTGILTSCGAAFVNGGAGGVQTTYQPGGFGGGGCAWWTTGNGGGGGGYSGGGTDGTVYVGGGGGGSYNSGTNQTNLSGNSGNTGDGKVIITRLCSVDIQASKNPICKGESITLSTNAVSNIVWAHNGSSNSSVNVSPAANTSYTVTGQAASGCTTSIALTVTVNPLPSLTSVVTPSVLCVGKEATVTASGANTYTWTTLSISAPTATMNPTVTTNYNYSGTNQYGCISSAVTTVVVNTNSLGITPNSSVCAGESILLTASNAVTYTWSTGNNFASTPVSPLTNTTYLASGTDIHNCVISNAVNITVQTRPNVSASASRNTICKGETANLLASGADTYTWSSGLGTGAQATINPPVDVLYSYTVTGTSTNGCTNTAVVSVNVSRCSGLNQLNKNIAGARIYPNPAGNAVILELDNGSYHTIEVVDLTGRTVMSAETEESSTRLNLENLSNGVYYFKVRSAEQTDVIKVVKNN